MDAHGLEPEQEGTSRHKTHYHQEERYPSPSAKKNCRWVVGGWVGGRGVEYDKSRRYDVIIVGPRAPP
jgi:hypothetical protein